MAPGKWLRYDPRPITKGVTSKTEAQLSKRSHTSKLAESRQTFQGRRCYALYSREGEPVAVTITTGVIAHEQE